jgi:hypothetical protein
VKGTECEKYDHLQYAEFFGTIPFCFNFCCVSGVPKFSLLASHDLHMLPNDSTSPFSLQPQKQPYARLSQCRPLYDSPHLKSPFLDSSTHWSLLPTSHASALQMKIAFLAFVSAPTSAVSRRGRGVLTFNP